VIEVVVVALVKAVAVALVEAVAIALGGVAVAVCRRGRGMVSNCIV